MISINSNRNDVCRKIKNEISCISRLLDSKFIEIIGSQRVNELKKAQKKLSILNKKLENNTFEISIVGLEKSGKSTFANAFMGIDILPTKDARCTYTATSICYGSNDNATVRFYSTEEFNNEFFNKVALAGFSDYDFPNDWAEWTIELLDELVLKSERLSSDEKNVINDIREIIENKYNIKALLDNNDLQISGEDLELDIKEYIECPSKALSVKGITINSSNLSKMKNAVIYDVPGFDSPTRLHKDQTLEWMKKSDAVILIVNADRPSFNDSLVTFFENVDKDDDGIKIGEKLFIFANRADIASTLSDNISKIKNELLKYNIIPADIIEKRIIAGSAKAKLDIETGNGEAAIAALKEKGLESDGIEDIRSMLTEYNDTIRVQVMQRRVNNVRQNLEDLLEEIRNENQITDDDSSAFEFENLVDDLKNSAKKHIRHELTIYRDHITSRSKEELPITSKVRNDIISHINPERYQITDEEIQWAKNRDLLDSHTILTSEYSIRQDKFSQMYNEFLNNVVNLAVEEYSESQNALVDAFRTGLGITSSHPYYEKLDKALREYVSEKCGSAAPEGYYSSLIRRYSRDLFTVLIAQPFGELSRFSVFDDERKNFYTLSLFGSDKPALNPAVQPMHYQILFHEKLEQSIEVNDDDILSKLIISAESAIGELIPVDTKLYNALKKFAETHGEKSADDLEIIISRLPAKTAENDNGLPLFAINPNPYRERLLELLDENTEICTSETAASERIFNESSYRRHFENYRKDNTTVKDEFRTDVIILKKLLNNHVMNAIAIEVPFLDLVHQNIISLKESLSTDLKKFINKNKSMILEKKSQELEYERELKRNRREILEEIERIITEKEYD